MFYAGVLKEMAQDTMQLYRFTDEFGYLIQYLNDDREFAKFLNSSDIPREFKYRIVDTTFKGKVNTEIISFFKLLIEENIHSNITEIYYLVKNDSMSEYLVPDRYH